MEYICTVWGRNLCLGEGLLESERMCGQVWGCVCRLHNVGGVMRV